jgi:H+/Cl- antiporter ClcA
VGLLVGAQIAGSVYNSFLGNATSLTLEQWQSFWWIPASFAVIVLVIFILLFRERQHIRSTTEEPVAMV